MPASLTTPSPAARAERERLLAGVEKRAVQGEFSYFIPDKFSRRTWLLTSEVAEMLEYTVPSVVRFAQETIREKYRDHAGREQTRDTGIYKLERYTLDDRKRPEMRFTLRGVLLFITERMSNAPEAYLQRLRQQLRKHGTGELRELMAFLQDEIQRRPLA